MAKQQTIAEEVAALQKGQKIPGTERPESITQAVARLSKPATAKAQARDDKAETIAGKATKAAAVAVERIVAQRARKAVGVTLRARKLLVSE